MPHFAFLDGALGYDCVRCGARCCKGLGFAFPAEQLLPLVTRVPTLAPFFQLQAKGVAAFTLSDGCWALADDGRCGVEVTHGREVKPSICKLFPLRVQRIGDQLLVSVQLTACPLEDARKISGGPGTTVLRHAELLRELDVLGAAPFYVDATLPPGAPDDALDREAAITQATRSALDAGDPHVVIDGAGEGRAALDGLRAGWRRFFGLPPDEASALDREVARPFALALPSLRAATLTAPGAPPYHKLVRGLLARLAAGAFLGGLSRRAGRAPSLRGLAELWRSTFAVREALARWDARPPLADTPAPATTPPELALALSDVITRAAQASLGEALSATTLPPALRPLLLRLVAERIS